MKFFLWKTMNTTREGLLAYQRMHLPGVRVRKKVYHRYLDSSGGGYGALLDTIQTASPMSLATGSHFAA